MKDKILQWFISGRVGLSSKAMASAIAEIECDKKNHPLDPDDLNRCLLFLSNVPEARAYLNKVSVLSEYWEVLIKRFDEVEKCFINEAGLNWSKAKSAPKTYKLMDQIFDPIDKKNNVFKINGMSFR